MPLRKLLQKVFGVCHRGSYPEEESLREQIDLDSPSSPTEHRHQQNQHQQHQHQQNQHQQNQHQQNQHHQLEDEEQSLRNRRQLVAITTQLEAGQLEDGQLELGQLEDGQLVLEQLEGGQEVDIPGGFPPPYMGDPPPYNFEDSMAIGEPPELDPGLPPELEPPPPYSSLVFLDLPDIPGREPTDYSSREVTPQTEPEQFSGGAGSESRSPNRSPRSQRSHSSQPNTSVQVRLKLKTGPRRSKRDGNLFTLMRNGNGLSQMISRTVGSGHHHSRSTTGRPVSASSGSVGIRSPEATRSRSNSESHRHRNTHSRRERSNSSDNQTRTNPHSIHRTNHRHNSSRTTGRSRCGGAAPPGGGGRGSDALSQKKAQLKELAREYAVSENPYRKLAIVMEIARLKNEESLVD